jgi:hypothetical protein
MENIFFSGLKIKPGSGLNNILMAVHKYKK